MRIATTLRDECDDSIAGEQTPTRLGQRDTKRLDHDLSRIIGPVGGVEARFGRDKGDGLVGLDRWFKCDANIGIEAAWYIYCDDKTSTDGALVIALPNHVRERARG